MEQDSARLEKESWADTFDLIRERVGNCPGLTLFSLEPMSGA
jgi:hypothetical protein